MYKAKSESVSPRTVLLLAAVLAAVKEASACDTWSEAGGPTRTMADSGTLIHPLVTTAFLSSNMSNPAYLFQLSVPQSAFKDMGCPSSMVHSSVGNTTYCTVSNIMGADLSSTLRNYSTALTDDVAAGETVAGYAQIQACSEGPLSPFNGDGTVFYVTKRAEASKVSKYSGSSLRMGR